LALLGVDAAITSASLLVALNLRFEGGPLPPADRQALPLVLGLLVASRVVVNLFFRLERWSFRFSGLPDGARVGMAGVFGTGLFTLALFLLRHAGPPRSVLVLELLMSTALMAAVRFGPRWLWLFRADLLRSRRSGTVRAVIVGAGAAGEMLLRDLSRSSDHDYQVLGFVDDDNARWGDIVGGKTVLGGISDLPSLTTTLEVQAILIAVPRMPAARVREILGLCADLKLRFKIVPVSHLDLGDRAAAAASLLQDLSPQDLLDREEVSFAHDEAVVRSLAERQVMVLGAAGSIGREVCRQLLDVGCRRLVMVDIDENGLYMLKRRFERLHPDDAVVAEIADVRDERRVGSLFDRFRPRDVFHAAARKHVPLMESAPCEAVKTNVFGTRILAQAALEHAAERFVYMSTDKAVRPSSVMGGSKRIGELVVRSLAGTSATRFSVVRFGNVLDSAGSVVPIFREQIAAGGPVTVTHPDARRFFMTISEAVGLVLKAAYGDYGELCVLEMGEPIRIVDLARHMITMSGLVPGIDVKIEFCGLRPGEKLEEEILADGETVIRRVDRKVRIVESSPPDAALLAGLDGLAAACEREDSEAVTRWLREAVNDSRPWRDPRPPGLLLALEESDGAGLPS